MPSAVISHADELERERSRALLQSSGWEVCTASDGHEAFQAALCTDRPQLIVAASDSSGNGLQLCAELRRRHVADTQPRIVLLGGPGRGQGWLDGLLAGCDDWLLRLDAASAARHTALAHLGSRSEQSEPGWTQALRSLGSDASGLLRLHAEELRGVVELHAGQVGLVRFEGDDSPFTWCVRSALRRTPAAVRAWLGELGHAPKSWERSLIDWGLWERARLRAAVRQHNLRQLRALSRLQLDVSFEPAALECAADLLFPPQQLLGELELAEPGWTPRLSLVRCKPSNDVQGNTASEAG